MRQTFFYFMIASLVSCKTVPNTNPSFGATNSSATTASDSSNASESLLYPLPPTAGELLSITIIEADETHVDNMGAIKVNVMADQNANYVQLWVCAKGNTSLCTPGPDQAMKSTTGEFLVFEIPAQTMTFYAQACVDPKNAIVPSQNCGSIHNQDFVSSVFPLNTPANTKTVAAIQTETNNIQTQCSNIQDAINTYLASSANNPPNPALNTLAQNQSNMIDPQFCVEYMGSNYYGSVSTTLSGTPLTPSKDVNYGIAMALGSLSVLSLAVGVHGGWRLWNALKERKNPTALLEIAKGIPTELTSAIAAKQALIAQQEALIAERAALIAQLSTDQNNASGTIQNTQNESERQASELANQKAELAQLQANLQASQKVIDDYTQLVADAEASNKLLTEKRALAKKQDLAAQAKLSDQENLLAKIEYTKQQIETEEQKLLTWQANKKLFDDANAGLISDAELQQYKSDLDDLNQKMYAKIQANGNPGELELHRVYTLNKIATTLQNYFLSLTRAERVNIFDLSLPSHWLLGFLYNSKTSDILGEGNAYSKQALEQKLKTIEENIDKQAKNLATIASLKATVSQDPTAEIQAKLASLKSDLSKDVPQSEDLKTEIASLASEMDAVNEEIANLTANENDAQTTELRNLLASAKASRDEIEQAILEKTTAIDALSSEVKRLQAALDQAKQNHSATAAQLADAQAALDQMNTDLAARQKEMDTLRQQLTAAQASKDNALAQVNKKATTTVASKAPVKDIVDKPAVADAHTAPLESKLKSAKIQMGAGIGGFVVFGAGAIASALAPGIGLVDSPQVTLQSAIDSAMTKIQKSQEVIQGYWQQLGGVAP